MGYRLLLCLALFSAAGQSPAQEEAAGDTLHAFELAEIVVSDEQGDVALPSTLQRVRLAAVDRADAAPLSAMARQIPAAFAQTNSRGESLVYLRGAGERQVAVFFDGALLNVPWDNRVDLSFIPTAMLGGLTVAKGVPSVLFGTNVIGGAVNLASRTLDGRRRHTEVQGQVGLPRAAQASIVHLGSTGSAGYAGSIGLYRRDGVALPAGAPVPYSQADTRLRTNTDARRLHVFGRASYRFKQGSRLGVSLLHLDGEKGVAPEGHLNPALSRVRFWRYPTWRNTLAVMNASVPLGGGTALRGALWVARFQQVIDQFRTSAYAVREAQEKDDDVTLGTRITVSRVAGRGVFRLALNALTSQHRQQDVGFERTEEAFPAGERIAPGVPVLTYRQHVLSVGLEYEQPLTRRLGAQVGGSLEGVAMPQTGDKPARDGMKALGGTAGLTYTLDEVWVLRAAAGRRVRFPTMRELFGEALNRFLLNEHLRPETALLAEIGVVRKGQQPEGEVVGFLNRTYDTIDQQSVVMDGTTKRQRVNLDGSRVYGVEATGAWQMASGWSVDGHVTWMRTHAFTGRSTRPLTEKPRWLSTLNLIYTAPWGTSVLGQAVYTGKAYALADDGQLLPLSASLVFSIRLAFRMRFGRNRSAGADLFFSVDNLTDEVALPQLGLPEPGRELRAGVKVAL